MGETWVRSLGQEDPWRMKWQSIPVLLPGKSHGQRSLVGYSPWGGKELDTTERFHFHFHFLMFIRENEKTHLKDPDTGKDWRQKEKGMTEDEMVGWHHWLNGHEFEEALGDGEGQGSLACCSPGSQTVGHNWLTEQQPYLCGISYQCGMVLAAFINTMTELHFKQLYISIILF